MLENNPLKSTNSGPIKPHDIQNSSFVSFQMRYDYCIEVVGVVAERSMKLILVRMNYVNIF